MPHPQFHLHLRKRANKKVYKYPSKDARIRLLDRFIVLLGFMNAFATLPQVFEVWIGQDASGVSVISWSYYTFFAFFLLVYGLVHKELPIIVTYTAGFFLYLLIVVGTLLYG